MNPLQIIGYLFIAFGIIDYAGQFFEYDLTGVSWSPMAAGALGLVFASVGSKED